MHPRRARVLIDWNFACVGNPVSDVAFWLPSLHAEEGPAPDEILPDGAAELAALIAGYFGAHAARGRSRRRRTSVPCSCAKPAPRCPGRPGRSTCRRPDARCNRPCTCNALLDSAPWNGPRSTSWSSSADGGSA